jgi:hypothetical protein
MNWFEQDLTPWVVPVTLGFALALTVLIVGFVAITQISERRRIRRYVEGHGGKVLDIHQVNWYRVYDRTPSNEPDRFRVRLRDHRGKVHTAHFGVNFLGRRVWTDTLLEDARDASNAAADLDAIREDNRRLRQEIAADRERQLRAPLGVGEDDDGPKKVTW